MKKLLFLLISSFAFSASQAQTLSAEQQAVKKVVVDFYKWYAANDAKLYNFKLYKECSSRRLIAGIVGRTIKCLGIRLLFKMSLIFP